MREFIVVTGMSGAGRSLAADCLEDMGWYVIDNLPPALTPQLVDHVNDSALDRVALVIGVGRTTEEIRAAIEAIRTSGAGITVVFLEARPRVLVQRYESVRRRHPLDRGDGLEAAIEAERESLVTVKSDADVVIDTSDYNVHGLRARMTDYFGEGSPAEAMRTRIVSFGYKHGVPLDVDVVFDCRFLPNPHWDAELRPYTGLEEPVRDFVLGQKTAQDFLDQLDDMLDLLVPAYVKEGKSFLTLAFGCTGGRHRSVSISEEVATRLRAKGVEPSIAHRDVSKPG